VTVNISTNKSVRLLVDIFPKSENLWKRVHHLWKMS